MNARKAEPLMIDYPKHWFFILAVVFEGTLAWLAYTAYANAAGDWKLMWLVVSPVSGILIALFLVPPMFTHHLAGEKSLKLRMGLLINATIPYAWVRQVKHTSVHWGGIRVGIGVRYFHISRILLVTSSFTELVSIKFDEEHIMGGLRKRRVEEVVMSVKHAQPVIEALRERARLAKGD